MVLSWLLRDFYAPRLRWFTCTFCLKGSGTFLTPAAALRACVTDACLGKQAVLRVRRDPSQRPSCPLSRLEARLVPTAL